MKVKESVNKEQQVESQSEYPTNNSISDLHSAALVSLSRFNLTEQDLEDILDRYSGVTISYIHSEDEGFLWKKLTRQEYKSVIESGATAKQVQFEEAIVRKCLIVPTPTKEFLSLSDAGIITTLFKQMMYQSGFIPEEIAIENVVEL